MAKKIFNIVLILVIITAIITGPLFFEKYWVDYKKSYESNGSIIEWKGVITLWDYPKLDTLTGSKHSWINKKIKEFEKLHPGTYIEYKTIDSINGKITLRAAAKINAMPDIAPVGSDIYFLSSGLLEPLDEYIAEKELKDFLQDALSSCIYKEKLYGIPWAKKAYTLLLNKDTFQEREVELPRDGFWSYEEFFKSLEKLTFASRGRGEVDRYGLVSSMETGAYNIFGILMIDGGVIYDKKLDKYAFDSLEALSGIRKLYELNNKYKLIYPGMESLSQNQAFNNFIEGNAAVFLGDAWMVAYLRNIGNKHGVNFTTANYPNEKLKFSLYANEVYYSYGVFKQDDIKKKEMCVEFIKYLSDKEFQVDLRNFGYFPVRKSSNYIYQNDKEMYAIQRGLDGARHISNHKNWWETDEILRSSIIDVLTDKKTPEEALREAKELTNKYFDNYMEKVN